MEAIVHRVPMVAIPVFADQPSTADALAEAGLATSFRYPLRTLTPDALRAAVANALATDSPCRAVLARVAERVQAEGGAAAVLGMLRAATATRPISSLPCSPAVGGGGSLAQPAAAMGAMGAQGRVGLGARAARVAA